MRENLKDLRKDMIRTTTKKRRIVIYLPFSEENVNIIQNSALRTFFKENSGIDLNLKKDSDFQNLEKDSATLEISPSIRCSPDIARLLVVVTMKFLAVMWKSPHQLSVAIKKKPKRTEEKHDPGAALLMREERISFLDKSGSDHGITGGKQTSLDILSTRREMIFLYRLDLKSRYFLLDLPMRAEIELNLRRDRAAMFNLESALKLLELRICRDLPASRCNLGVIRFSGWKSGGYIIEREIGCNPKRTFILAANE